MKKILYLLIICLFFIIIFFWLPKWIAGIFYPIKYHDSIKKYSLQYKIDPNLTSAVILSESRYNPNAQSPAGAQGLMQLLPSTAQAVSAQLGEKSFDPKSLVDPDHNIKYGTYYLASYINKYHDDETALIAYNAGEAVADTYNKTKTGRPNETIKYTDTVLHSQKAYNQLYGEWWSVSDQKSSWFDKIFRTPPNIINLIKLF